MSFTVTKDGVIDYPIADGMPLIGIWQYGPNANGATIVAKQEYLDISRGSSNADNQWTNLSIQHSLQVANGSVFRFDIKYNAINPATEVKLTLASGVVLRYDGTNFNYCWWSNDGFHQLGRSTISIGSDYVQVTLCFWPAGIAIFENGNFIAKWDKGVEASVIPLLTWQLLSRNSSLSAQIRSIFIIPSTFATSVNTPWDIAFSDTVIPSADIWEVSKQKDDPLPNSYSKEGYMRVSTNSLSIRNSWIFPKVAVPMDATGVVMYRMRVNSSGGSETKVTVLGDNILRIVQNGQVATWNKYASDFVKLSDSSVRVGSGLWTIVTLVYSSRSVSLFEDGVYRYTRAYDAAPGNATFSVQHLEPNTAVSVDISHVRCVPLKKNAEMLLRDLQPALLAYYPLKADISEAIIEAPALDLAAVDGYQPDYTEGAFGKAISFAEKRGALRLPLFPYGRTFPSYTLSLWVKVNNYPATKAGITGPLSILSNGKLEYSFLYSQILSFKRTNFTSKNAIPLGQWVCIVVTYAYEESRFAFFVDGVLDSIVYTSSDNSSQNAVLPIYGFIGASRSDDGESLNILDGAVGDVFFFQQHIHGIIALALSDKLRAEHNRPRRVLFLVIPAFLVLAYGAVSTAVIATTLKQTTPQLAPDLQVIVDRIVQVVGKPARPGAQVSRDQIGLDEKYPITIDIGGEGPLNQDGLVTGFHGAINVNAVEKVTVGGSGKIPYLVMVQPWPTNPKYPFADNFADTITMIGAPLTPTNADEMVRVIKAEGVIDVWIDDSFIPQLESMARKLKSSVNTPDQLDRFEGNGKTFFQRRQIKANKNGKDEL
ncbi:hypothetical protein SERLA73DRAFT_164129 [Serpula lacrymans var. lacrymans S7.3]|uniref:Uncharacterized protein n=1 Tax=Serpula lacrymans var. lacrymans (strain S7.3) TaxID=936435 RepID=F8QHA2_SERL3|nr:hypothetical protein SERLA73DRAFT_164129 [Serpula lacrymans var. lacrymans S7.3]